MEAILFASTCGNKYPRTNRTDAIIQRVPIQTINGSNYYVSTLTHEGQMEYVGLTVRMPRDVWMVVNLFIVKMIDINKIKELRLGPTFKRKKNI